MNGSIAFGLRLSLQGVVKRGQFVCNTKSILQRGGALSQTAFRPRITQISFTNRHTRLISTFSSLRNSSGVDDQPKKKKLPTENIYNLPNALAFSRVLMTPFISYDVLQGNYGRALCTLFVAGLTDILDGWTARRFGMETTFGTAMDPMADKFLIGTTACTLVYSGLLPTWLFSLIILRDSLLLAVGFTMRWRNLPEPSLKNWLDARQAAVKFSPTALSKTNTFLQGTLFLACIAAPWYGIESHSVLTGLQYVVACTTVTSGFEYLLSKDTVKFIDQQDA
eukprot:Clim_evm13s219 gene=Clim_evmTU13s219